MAKVKLHKCKRLSIDSYVGGVDEYIKFIKDQAVEHINNPAFEPIYLSVISKKDIDSTDGDMLQLKLTTDLTDPNRDIIACYRINEHLAMYYDGEIYFTAFYYNWDEYKDNPAIVQSTRSNDSTANTGHSTRKTIYRNITLDYLTKAKAYGLLDSIQAIIAFVFK